MAEATLTKTLTDFTEKASGKIKATEDKLAEVVAWQEKVHKMLSRPDRGNFAVVADHSEERQWGYKSFGQFAKDVHQSGITKRMAPGLDTMIGTDYVKKAATDMGELVGSDGGFLVPPQFADKIFERVYKENPLISRTDQYTLAGNTMVFPRNAESSRANGSRWGGVRAYWVQEGTAGTHSKPTFGRFTVNMGKLMCLAAITDELLADSGPALNQYLNRVFAAEISFTAGDAIVRGTGAGQPLGILNATDSNGTGCTVSVSTASVGASLSSADIVNMWARLFRGMGGEPNSGAVWFINQDVGPALHLLTLGIGTAGIATYMPPNGLSGPSYGTLMGAPIIPVEWCSTLGTTGDIILADMSQYVTISKGGMNAMSSIHLYFDSDQEAFRVTFRMGGAPWWATALTPYQGTNKQSPFVILATR
jgi:HK97 family phage major capsid protein